MLRVGLLGASRLGAGGAEELDARELVGAQVEAQQLTAVVQFLQELEAGMPHALVQEPKPDLGLFVGHNRGGPLLHHERVGT